jgi:threonine dehydrogenase-like Zn-dependent dehydrogenase
MKGVVYLGDSKVEVRDFPRPEPGLGQVVTEMKVAGLCGSDLHKYHSSQQKRDPLKFNSDISMNFEYLVVATVLGISTVLEVVLMESLLANTLF